MDAEIEDLKTKARKSLLTAKGGNETNAREFIEVIDALIQARIEAAVSKLKSP